MLNGSKKPNDTVRLEKIKSNLEFRARFLKNLRDYFYANNFLETETPLMLKSPAPEDYINAPQAGDFFLRTSPELHMKRLVAAGFEKIFQIGSCFRAGEIGKIHNVEFTMLEWYQSDGNYLDMLSFTKNMLISTVKATTGSSSIKFKNNIIEFDCPWEILTVHEAFEKFTDTTPEKAIEENNFEIILTEDIEPWLLKGKPVIIKDYPISMAALSKVKENDSRVAERWELYLGGIEIANAYSELTDPLEQRKRFKQAHINREKSGLPKYSEDNDFFEALEYGMKPYTGIALGIDRLMMVLTDSLGIKEVISFIEESTFPN